MRDLLQAARPHAVGAFLVFLNLLEGQAERLPKLFLAHSEHLPAHPDPAAHVFVDRVLFDFLFHDTSELLMHGAAGSTLAGVTMVRVIYSAATSCVRPVQTRRRSHRRRPRSGAACAARPPSSTSLILVQFASGMTTIEVQLRQQLVATAAAVGAYAAAKELGVDRKSAIKDANAQTVCSRIL
jgi:hypothetical protein